MILISIFFQNWNLRRILFIFIHSLINSKSNELPQSLGCLWNSEPSKIYIFARDQAVLKTLFFAADRAVDLLGLKAVDILLFPDKSGFLINHIWTKSLWSCDANMFLLLGHPLFFLRLGTSDRPKFLAFSKKKEKSNDVAKQFFTWNNSFNLKNERGNSIEKNRN